MFKATEGAAYFADESSAFSHFHLASPTPENGATPTILEFVRSAPQNMNSSTGPSREVVQGKDQTSKLKSLLNRSS